MGTPIGLGFISFYGVLGGFWFWDFWFWDFWGDRVLGLDFGILRWVLLRCFA
jgi:hypothetical protein